MQTPEVVIRVTIQMIHRSPLKARAAVKAIEPAVAANAVEPVVKPVGAKAVKPVAATVVKPIAATAVKPVAATAGAVLPLTHTAVVVVDSARVNKYCQAVPRLGHVTNCESRILEW